MKRFRSFAVSLSVILFAGRVLAGNMISDGDVSRGNADSASEYPYMTGYDAVGLQGNNASMVAKAKDVNPVRGGAYGHAVGASLSTYLFASDLIDASKDVWEARAIEVKPSTSSKGTEMSLMSFYPFESEDRAVPFIIDEGTTRTIAVQTASLSSFGPRSSPHTDADGQFPLQGASPVSSKQFNGQATGDSPAMRRLFDVESR